MDTSTGFDEDTFAADRDVADEPVRTALRQQAHATPEVVGGFCEDGLGVFLTAANNTAELTLYVVPPATIGTFQKPALYLTTPEGTETVEFDDVTLRSGESHVFRQEVAGNLMEAFADFADGPS